MMKMLVKQRIKYIIIKLIQIFFNNKEEQNNKFNKSKINKMCIIRLDEIGDVVMTTPFIRELRRNFPKAEITLIVKSQTYNLVELCPYVDKILTFNRYAGRFSFFINIFKAYSFSKKFLQKEEFDLCIIPRWDTDVYGASYLAYFSKAKRRIAYSECVSIAKSIENKGFDDFFTDVITKTEHLHEVERNLDVIRFFGGEIFNENLELWISKDDYKSTNNIIDKEKINILFCPSAGSKRREWDIDKYCEVLNLLNKKFDFKLIVLGDIKNTFKVLQNLKEKYSGEVIDLVGKTTLRETVALMKRADVFIGGDTGPMHIAAACKIDGVVVSCHPKNGDIHHGNSPKRFGPWKSPLVVLQPEQGLDDCRDGCNKNYAHCINQITVEKVYRELEKILEKKVKEKSGGKQ